MASEQRKHHKTTNIKPCSIVDIRFHPLQSIECFQKAWPRPKAYQCQEPKQWTLRYNVNPYQNGRVLGKVVWNHQVSLQGQKDLWNVWKPYLKYHQLKVVAIEWRLIFLNPTKF